MVEEFEKIQGWFWADIKQKKKLSTFLGESRVLTVEFNVECSVYMNIFFIFNT